MIYLQSPDPFVSAATLWQAFGYKRVATQNSKFKYEVTTPAIEASDLLKAFMDAELQFDLHYYSNRSNAIALLNFFREKVCLYNRVNGFKYPMIFTDAKNPNHAFLVMDLIQPGLDTHYDIYYISVINYNDIAQFPTIVGHIQYKVGEMINKKLQGATALSEATDFNNRVLYSEPFKLATRIETHKHFCLECFPADALFFPETRGVIPYRFTEDFIKQCCAKNSTFYSKGELKERTIHLI